MKLNLSRLLLLGSGARASDPLSLDTAIIDGPTSMTPGLLKSAVPGQVIQPSGAARIEVRNPPPETPPPSPALRGAAGQLQWSTDGRMLTDDQGVLWLAP